MSAERWLPIVGWEGLYEVSDQGRIRSSEGRRQRSVIRRATEYNNGYLYVCLSAPGRRVRTSVHRAVLAAFVGPCPEGQQGCHNNGVRTDNRIENLRWDTPLANSADKVAHGTVTRTSQIKTHCKRGHEYTAENTYTRFDGKYPVRTCRTCRRVSEVAYRTRKAAGASSVAALLLVVASLALPLAANATPGPDHREQICHPVNGAGQTGTGWTLVDVDKASSHFDKDGHPKHTSHDGRTDTYAINGVCPSTSTPTGSPSPTTGSTPSTPPATTTTASTSPPTPSSSTTPPADPTVSTTPPAPTPTTTSLSPSPTSSTPTTAATPPASSSTTSTSAPTTPSDAPTTTSAQPSHPTSDTKSSSPTSPRRSGPSSSVAPPEQLAHTGATLTLLALALGLLVAGAGVKVATRRGGRHAR